MNSNNSAPINESLGFFLVQDPNLNIILNDFDVTQPIKNLIVQMSTDKLYISKLSNAVQPDDFQLLGNIKYQKSIMMYAKEMKVKYFFLIPNFYIKDHQILKDLI